MNNVLEIMAQDDLPGEARNSERRSVLIQIGLYTRKYKILQWDFWKRIVLVY